VGGETAEASIAPAWVEESRFYLPAGVSLQIAADDHHVFRPFGVFHDST
jgi:hypothetical protein